MDRIHSDSFYVCYMSLNWLQLLLTLWMNDAYNVLSSRALLSDYRFMSMASFIESFILYLVFFSAAFYFSQHHCLFQRTLTSHDVTQGQLKFCHFLPPEMFHLPHLAEMINTQKGILYTAMLNVPTWFYLLQLPLNL